MAGPSVNSTSAASNEPRRLSPLRQAGFEDRSSREGDADTDPKDAVDLRQVARRLNDEKPQQAEAARKELQSRGFSAVEVDVARQLLHPDAAVRRKLARSLPETVGVDAAPWLLELSRDPDADVRLEAMTLLVTTGDPVLLDALRKLVAADPDERIQRLSVRLSRASLLPEKNVTK
jgi:HEAT repeat protein